MNINEAYDLTISIVKKLEKSGILVEIMPSRSRNIPDTVAKYSGINNIKSGKWVHVTFYPINKAQSRAIHEQARYLGNLGITFDNGGDAKSRDWELDWSFRCENIPDSEREEARDIVEDMIDEM